MTSRYQQSRSRARSLGLYFDNPTGPPDFTNPDVLDFFARLLRNVINQSPQAVAAMAGIIDIFGPRLWGVERGHLLRAGSCAEYHDDLRWPRDRQKYFTSFFLLSSPITDFAKDHQHLRANARTRDEDRTTQPREEGHEARLRGPYVHSRNMNGNASTDRTAVLDGPAPKRKPGRPPTKPAKPATLQLPHLRHVRFWLWTDDHADRELHGDICLQDHKTISGLFHAVQTAMISADSPKSHYVVEKLSVVCPAQTGLIDEEIFDSKTTDAAFRGFRTRMNNAIEQYYEEMAGQVAPCFVKVEFRKGGASRS